MLASYIYTQLSKDEQLHQILELQKDNSKDVQTPVQWQKEGFVTCRHDYHLLLQMNMPYPHIVALREDIVVGYCLVMQIKWRDALEVLQSMFRIIDTLSGRGKPIQAVDYIVMGQVCVAQDHRGKGVFRGMYEHYRQCLSPHYKYCITEIATENTRSLGAHLSIGFVRLKSYTTPSGYSWNLVLWEWRK